MTRFEIFESGADMDAFTELKTIVTRLNEEGEFPTWLMTDILAIAGDPVRYADKVHLIEQLITQVDNFDAYAGAGCFDTSVSAETIKITVQQIMTKQHCDDRGIENGL